MGKKTSKYSYKFVLSDDGQRLDVSRDDVLMRTYDVSKLNAKLFEYTAGHGLKQKLTDDTMEKKLDGADRFVVMDELYAGLTAKDATVDESWDKEREGTKRYGEAVIQLIMKLTKQDRSVSLASLKGTSPEKLEAIKVKFAKDLAEITKEIAEAQSKATGIGLDALVD